MRHKELSNSYLSDFCTELAMLLQAGLTPLDSIFMMSDDETDKDGKAVINSLLAPTESGSPLSVSLRESGYFPVYMTNMLKIGEETGRLTETLTALSEYYDRQDRLAVTIKNSVLYPAMLLVMMIVVVLILIIQVLPIFNDVFSRLGAQMSPLAATLMRFGVWLRSTAEVIAVIACVIILAAIAAWAMPRLRNGMTGALRSIAGSRGVFGKIASARFMSAMTLAVESGLDTGKAVEMASSVSAGSRAVEDRNKKCAELLASGSALHEALREAGILSARDSRLLSIGSRSGAADAAMAGIAVRLDRDAHDGMDSLVGKIEPSLVIITSVMVGVILLSVMLPLIGIMTAM